MSSYLDVIMQDIRQSHQDAKQIEVVREEDRDNERVVVVEVRTESVSLFYTYTIDKSSNKILSKELSYVVPLL